MFIIIQKITNPRKIFQTYDTINIFNILMSL